MQLRLVQDFGVVEGAAVITLNQVAFSPGGGSITWPVTIVSATSAIYLVPTTIDGAATPQVAKLDYDADGFARLAVGFAYPGLFGGEATGDLRLNAAEGFFAGTCGGPATARILMPAAGTSITLEANTVKAKGQGFRVEVVGVEWIWPTADAAGAFVSDGAGNLSFVEAPTTDGTYVLTATVSGGTPAFSWEVGGTSPPPPPPPPGTPSLDFSDPDNSMYYGSLV